MEKVVIRKANINDIEDVFDLLHFRVESPLDLPLSNVSKRDLGLKVWAANDYAVYSGVLTGVKESENIAVLNDKINVALSSCVLVN